CEVLLIGAQPALAPDAGAREKLPAVERLRGSPDVTIELRTTVEAIGEQAITCGRDGTVFTIENPGIVIASHGILPAPAAADQLGLGLPADRVVVAGDALTGA